jgi:hypothetical protein
MACGFGWEVAKTFRDSRQTARINLNHLQAKDLCHTNVELTGFAANSDELAKKITVPASIVLGPGGNQHTYLPLVPSQTKRLGEHVVIAHLTSRSPDIVANTLGSESLQGVIRAPFQKSIFAADELEVLRDLVPDIHPANVWFFYPADLDRIEAKNPWFVFFRSLLIVGGVTGVLIITPLKELLFVDPQRRMLSHSAGVMCCLAASYALIYSPRGPAIWNSHTTFLSMYVVALAAGTVIVSLFVWVSDSASASQKKNIEVDNQFAATHRLGKLQYEYKEIDDTVALMVALVAAAAYTLVVWNVVFPSWAKMIGGALFAISAVGCCYLVPQFQSILRYYDQGIEIHTRALGKFDIPFSEVRRCNAELVHETSSGVYTGSRIKLKIEDRSRHVAHKLSVRRDTVGYRRALQLVDQLLDAADRAECEVIATHPVS